jgi:hypothetical protein
MLGLNALNRGDNAGATTLLEQVIAVDPVSAEATLAKTILDTLKK